MQHSQQSDQSSVTAAQGGDAADDAAVSSAPPPVEDGAPIEISWDLDASPGVNAALGDDGAAHISWDVDVEPASIGDAGKAQAGVNWDVDMGAVPMNEPAHAGAAVSNADGAVEIDWGVEMEAGGTPVDDDGAGVSIDWDIDVGDGPAGEPQPRATAGSEGGEHASSPGDRLAAALATDSDFRNRRFLLLPALLRHDLTLSWTSTARASHFALAACARQSLHTNLLWVLMEHHGWCCESQANLSSTPRPCSGIQAFWGP